VCSDFWFYQYLVPTGHFHSTLNRRRIQLMLHLLMESEYWHGLSIAMNGTWSHRDQILVTTCGRRFSFLPKCRPYGTICVQRVLVLPKYSPTGHFHSTLNRLRIQLMLHLLMENEYWHGLFIAMNGTWSHRDQILVTTCGRRFSFLPKCRPYGTICVQRFLVLPIFSPYGTFSFHVK
jgi:hypothetical protein